MKVQKKEDSIGVKDTKPTPIVKNITLIYNQWPRNTNIFPENNSIISHNRPTFTWKFNDTDSVNQSEFQVVVDDDINFTSIDYDSG